jgi:hypothetical protein
MHTSDSRPKREGEPLPLPTTRSAVCVRSANRRVRGRLEALQRPRCPDGRCGPRELEQAPNQSLSKGGSHVCSSVVERCRSPPVADDDSRSSRRPGPAEQVGDCSTRPRSSIPSRCGGVRRSSTRRVTAIAMTPSLSASARVVLRACGSGGCRFVSAVCGSRRAVRPHVDRAGPADGDVSREPVVLASAASKASSTRV